MGQGSTSLDFPWNMIEAVDGMPNLGVSQGQTYVFNQRPEEDEVALPSLPETKPNINHPRQSQVRLRRLRPLWQFQFNVLTTTAATPHHSRLIRCGQPRKQEGSDLRHLNRLCRGRRLLRSLGKVNFCVEMTAAASFIPPSSRM